MVRKNLGCGILGIKQILLSEYSAVVAAQLNANARRGRPRDVHKPETTLSDKGTSFTLFSAKLER